ncbi:putative fibroblast growth factor receptor 2-like, partial [Apostichopus japonicus]
MFEYFIAEYRSTEGKITVLAKRVAGGVTVPDARRLMAATKMQTSIPNHRNVVSLIGMDTEQVPSYTFHEFQERGNVRDFLLRNCQDITGYDKHCATSVSDTSSQLFHTKLIGFANDVANAMEFLHGHQFYHPAICARKTLLDRHFRCKLFAFWPQEAADDIVKTLLDA